MKLAHKEPCKECPWRLNAPQGYLGSNQPTTYADIVDNNEVPPCHLTMGRPKSRQAMCVGALATMSNQCKSAYNTPGGIEATNAIGRRADCFKNVFEFFKYHTKGLDYVPRLLRMLNASKT